MIRDDERGVFSIVNAESGEVVAADVRAARRVPFLIRRAQHGDGDGDASSE